LRGGIGVLRFARTFSKSPNALLASPRYRCWPLRLRSAKTMNLPNDEFAIASIDFPTSWERRDQ
jgi:hypothetical protein